MSYISCNLDHFFVEISIILHRIIKDYLKPSWIVDVCYPFSSIASIEMEKMPSIQVTVTLFLHHFALYFVQNLSVPGLSFQGIYC